MNLLSVKNIFAFISGMMQVYFAQKSDDKIKKRKCSKSLCPMQYNTLKSCNCTNANICQYYTPLYSKEEISEFFEFFANFYDKYLKSLDK